MASARFPQPCPLGETMGVAGCLIQRVPSLTSEPRTALTADHQIS